MTAAERVEAGQPTSPSSVQRQIVYFGTGALAGLTVSPVEGLWSRYVEKSKTTTWWRTARAHAPALTGRAAVRFWIFDRVKLQLDRHAYNELPLWVRGGLGGASGGFAEICAQSLVKKTVPTLPQLSLQSCRLFCAFGTFTFLSSSLSDDGPPRPAALCWVCGAAAGTVASSILGAIEGNTPSQLLKAVVPKGALVIGTTIAVQVISCYDILKHLNE